MWFLKIINREEFRNIPLRTRVSRALVGLFIGVRAYWRTGRDYDFALYVSYYVLSSMKQRWL